MNNFNVFDDMKKKIDEDTQYIKSLENLADKSRDELKKFLDKTQSKHFEMTETLHRLVNNQKNLDSILEKSITEKTLNITTLQNQLNTFVTETSESLNRLKTKQKSFDTFLEKASAKEKERTDFKHECMTDEELTDEELGERYTPLPSPEPWYDNGWPTEELGAPYSPLPYDFE